MTDPTICNVEGCNKHAEYPSIYCFPHCVELRMYELFASSHVTNPQPPDPDEEAYRRRRLFEAYGYKPLVPYNATPLIVDVDDTD